MLQIHFYLVTMNKPATIDEYIYIFPKEVQLTLNELRRVIINEAPDVKETINYGIPTFKLNGNLVHFAAYKNHIGFYPGSSGVNYFSHKLKQYKCSKGTIQFPINQPLPYDLIKEIVRFRVKENLEKR